MTTIANPADEPTAAHSNRLAGESSPYLLLHQHNPVDWYPWGDEALDRAREEGKPIFLSVGYSTCYWCHVMERESFSNPEIAALMNRHFINVKVDREERPDLDEVYMTATQILSQGHGGWPNSVFLTPELKPFFAGTYFPPQDRYGRPGFPSLLRSIADAWENRRPDLEAQAEKIARMMQGFLEDRGQPAAAPPAAAVAEQGLTELMRTFDDTWGGFGSAPKFPTPSNLFLLLDWTDERPEAARQLEVTLDQMARGGMFDQVGGGFHRYSTDERWLVPHFEKMLYDNGQLIEVYAGWYARTGEAEAARIVRETAEFLAREMTSPEGAFMSAIDAETDAREGAFYVWTRREIEAAIGREEADFLAPIYGFDDQPFFRDPHHPEAEPTYVFHLPETISSQAARLGISEDSLLARIGPLREKLLAHRARRRRPLTDDKILTDWNGMAIAGLAVAGKALDEPELIERAARAADFVLGHLLPGGGPLHHSWRGGRAKIPAYLADYAFFVRGLLTLHEATGKGRWLRAATLLTEEQIDRLGDPGGGFFVAAAKADLLFRSKDIGDGAIPSANAVAVLNLLALAERTGEPRWRRQGTAALRAFAGPLESSPGRFLTLALAARRYRATAEDDRNGAPRVPPAVAVSELEERALALVIAETRLGTAEGTNGSSWRPLEVLLEIADGWHVNANPASNEFLIPTRIEAHEGDLRDLRYPPGRKLASDFSEDEITVYDGKVTIHGELRPTGAGETTLRLTYQACDEERCLPPVRRELAIP
ncbi:MAG: DUF255 domain-containing protein [bacterium]|nr:DUF255 domain-containing protein [bacterium]